MPDPATAWEKLLDWATGEDGTREEQEIAGAIAQQDLYGDPDGLTQLVDELRRENPNAKAEGAEKASSAPEARKEGSTCRRP